jgi:hypothetical protein
MAALIDGTRIADSRWGIALADTAGGFVRKVIWPHGYVAQLDGDRLAVLDLAFGDHIVAQVGDRVQVGGGQINSDELWLACGGITVVQGG